jgi:hypothetical protein
VSTVSVESKVERIREARERAVRLGGTLVMVKAFVGSQPWIV